MLQIGLNEILGIHPQFARVERDLNLAPMAVPSPAIMPMDKILMINQSYPIPVVNTSGYLCIGHTTQYRWLVAHVPPTTKISCIVLEEPLTPSSIYQRVLIERLVMSALFQITSLQVQDLYQHITPPTPKWKHGYLSHAHLARLVGVKALKGAGKESVK
ncbi:hypothetical protein [Halopseudomonas sp.]|jgi:hypothetical protein|uniref:hypothetical protein n=1 Tax=Halopseudomonas sp. TaxID=2901191 RepID=UPI0039E460F8